MLEPPAVLPQLLAPFVDVHAKRRLDRGLSGGDIAHLEIRRARRQADRSLLRPSFALAALQDPLDHPHVLAVAGPEELAVRTLAEPVDQEDPGRPRHARTHLQPV